MRRHSVDEVIGEIDYILSHYERIKMLIFDDDIFTFDREWLREFSEKYRQVTRMGFVVNAHVKVFDEDVARSLKEAGCRIVKFGLESGSDRIRRNVLNRYMSNAEIERAFGIAHKFGLHTSAFVMIGLPLEEEEDILATIRLLSRMQPGRFRWSLFFPFIGTRAYDVALNHGSIDFQKMALLDNFTDETCMILNDKVGLLVEKVKECFCAFVNGYADEGNVKGYRKLITRIEKADRGRWEQEKEEIKGLIAATDRRMETEGQLHYQVRFNRFMGVRSDWKDDHLSA
jgi:anaerobic magnesium-protoporphyrin IX monomethyl ester cyclase